MRTVVHLSDLHFSKVAHRLLTPLVEAVIAATPDVVVVSGDLTQRARTAEFLEARAFLERLPRPQVVVRGNHDVLLHNVLHRWLRPLEKFQLHVESNLTPSFVDTEIAVVGVNTARSLALKNGRINAQQLECVRSVFAGVADAVVKVVVTHHPFDVPPVMKARARVGRAGLAIPALARCGVDLLLAGHLHASRASSTGDRYPFSGYEALIVSAGTATSTRGRGEANSFNLLRLSKTRIEVERLEWVDERQCFLTSSLQVFARNLGGGSWIACERR